MTNRIKVVHYINQFFGQIGGEDKAGIPPQIKEGPVGVGQLIQEESGGQFEIVRTILCGDNYAAEHLEEVEKIVLKWTEELKPDLFLAGPAFAAGRYGIACGTLCKAVQQKLGIPALSAMHVSNPGVDAARKEIYILEAGDSTRDMRRVIPKMVSLAQKILDKVPIGLPQEEGYFSRGIRINIRAEKRGSKRAVEMLLKKLRGEPFETELPLPEFDRVAPAPPITDLSNAVIALVTEGGIVPKGNPDRIEAHNASKYCKYFIGNVSDLTGEAYQTAHGGYDPVYANDDPDRVLPLDAARLLEKEGVFKKLFDYYYVTVGNVTAVASAARYGHEIGELLLKEGVQGVILTSTWGTGTRCGATMVKEIERVGLPAVQICAIVPIAMTVGANRIVRAVAIPHPTGDPKLEKGEEIELRKKLLKIALIGLSSEIQEQTVFK